MGFKPVAINTLSSRNVLDIIQLDDRGWFFPETKEEFEKCINDFINIYSLICKNHILDRPTDVQNVKRGTDFYDEILKQGKMTGKFVSASKSFDIAETFGNTIIECRLGTDIPYIDVTKFMKKYSQYFQMELNNQRDEGEIIIAPFVNISSVKEVNSSFKDYKVEFEKLRSEIVEEYEQHVKDINELKSMMNKRGVSLEEIKTKREKRENTRE